MSAFTQQGRHETAMPGQNPLFMQQLQRLASLKLTLCLFMLLLLCIAVYAFAGLPYEWLIATPLLLLAINLGASIATQPAFRQKIALLSFHLALLLLLAILVLGRLTYLKGETEVTSGSEFTGQLTNVRAGPWHHFGIARQRFYLDHFTVDYAEGRNRKETASFIRWTDAKGRQQQGVIGDHHPLILGGYRFYTSHNKGFAPLFSWHPHQGETITGAIHFPSFPINEFGQSQEWTIPGTRHRLWGQLDTDETLIDPAAPAQFRLPQQHHLIIRIGEERHELRPGEQLEFDDGVLVYEELRSWMGFKVSYDWTLPWLLAAGILAVLSLGWHYWARSAARPWLNDEERS